MQRLSATLAAVALFACACATAPVAPAPEPVMQLEDLDYDTARGDAVAEGEGSLRADITILTLDAAAAEALLGIDDPYDIEPRRFKRPMGEVAAANASSRHGCEVLTRPSFWVTEGADHSIEYQREVFRVVDWVEPRRHSSPTPVLGMFIEGVRGKVRCLANGDGGWSLSVDSHAAFLAQSETYVSSLGVGEPFIAQDVKLVQLHRVAVETIIPGETAMYQLARTSCDGKDYCHLLFIRLTAVELSGQSADPPRSK